MFWLELIWNRLTHPLLDDPSFSLQYKMLWVGLKLVCSGPLGEGLDQQVRSTTCKCNNLWTVSSVCYDTKLCVCLCLLLSYWL